MNRPGASRVPGAGRIGLAAAIVVGAVAALSGCAAETSGGSSAQVRLTFTPAAVLKAAAEAARSSDPSAAGGPAAATAAPTAVTGAPAGSLVTGRRARSVTDGPLTVFSQGRAGARVVAVLPATTALGSARVLKVLQVVGDWVLVALPVRPNGTTGWVRASDVQVQDVTQRIVVDLSARSLRWWADGVQVLTATVAVGAPATPTPKGSFFVTDRVRTPDPKGMYGPFALGLSAHSEKLTEFGDGDAQIGIHGTDRPDTLGTPTTHGCVRVPNAIATRLQDVPLGTPVDIVA